jgi:hypothetical protein
MSRPSKSERLRRVHTAALDRFDEIQGAVRYERLQCLQDRRFYSIPGAQWEGPLSEQFENKPKFEVNKVHLAVLRIVNEYRNNRITVDFIPKEGAKYDELADLCDGLYRADEQDSCAEEAYDNAFEEGCSGGIGAWRLRTGYVDEEDDEDERQRIRIEPIFDADSSVFWDLNAKRQDKSDAKYCYVVTSMTREAYKEEWQDDPASWPKEIHQYEFDWATPDVVFVAEYYEVEEQSYTVHVFQDLAGREERYTDQELEDDPEKVATLAAVGTRKVREKRAKRKRVHKYILSGSGVLEDCGLIAGPNIPIVMVYGKRWYVDNIERAQGQVRLAKDSQRLKNMQLSNLGTLSVKSPVEKPIFTPEQVARHTVMWSEDDVKDYPYLLIDALKDANGQPSAVGPVAYTKPPQIPQAMAALLEITESDMRQILGTQPEAEKMVSNISGDAIELIQTRLDLQSYIYISNFAKGAKRSGEIWLGMAREVYVEDGRKMKTLNAGMEPGVAELNVKKMGEDGEIEFTNDLSEARFDVSVDVGPSTVSRRNSTVRMLTSMMGMTDDPEMKQVLGAMAMMNMEGEGLQDVRAYFRRKLLRMGAIKPTEEEADELAQTKQDDPQSTYLNAAAEQAQAEAARARADTVYTVARAEETQAKTLKIASEIDANEQAQALEVIDRMAGNAAPEPAPVQPM